MRRILENKATFKQKFMNCAIILAAGRGQRMKSRHDKLLLNVGGRPIVYHTLMAFNDHPEIDQIILVVNKSNKSTITKLVKTCIFKKVKKIIIGGLTRQKSFARGFATMSAMFDKISSDDIVLSHNADNPCVSCEEIANSIEAAKEHGACIVGHYLTSTIKEINAEHIIKTHDRNRLFAAETPQVAQYSILKKALENAARKKLEVTDEAMLLEKIGQKITYLEAGENNFKITTNADLHRLRAVFGDLPEDFRVGIGQDSHMFCPSDSRDSSHKNSPHLTTNFRHTYTPHLTLAGLSLPDYPKLKANSDGDVILHAVFNALSQAIGDMSLGFYADEICKKGEKDSRKYLEIILKKVRQQKFTINNLGIMIECKTPKIDPLSAKLKKSLSLILDLPIPRIGITATTGENLTLFGAGLGIQCFAIVSLVKNP